MRMGILGFTGGLVVGLVAAVVLAGAPPANLAAAVPTPRPFASTPPAVPVATTPPAPACTPAPLAERAGLVLLVGLPEVTDPDAPLVQEVLDVGVAGVLLTDANVVGEQQVQELIAGLDAGSRHPVLVATDEEPGRVSSFGTLLGRTSSARTLAARGTPADVRQFAEEMGTELADFGVDIDLAPVADVDDGPAGGIIGDRSFSGDPEIATTYALAFSEGLMDAGVVPTVKHFPGHGRSATDSHRDSGLVEAPLSELRATDLQPFQAQIDAGMPVVMLSHVAYEALDGELPASLDPAAYDLLRDMGFDGVAMTDSLGMGAVNLRWPFPEAAIMAIAAGADLALATDGNQARAMRDAIVAAVETGVLPEARLDQAVTRVLTLTGTDPAGIVCPATP